MSDPTFCSLFLADGGEEGCAGMPPEVEAFLNCQDLEEEELEPRSPREDTEDWPT